MAELKPSTEYNGGWMVIDLTGIASTAIGYVKNPEGVTVQILRTYCLVTTASTGAATLSVGISSTTTGSATDVLSALTLNGVTANTVYLGNPGGDAAKDSIYGAPALWTTSNYLTFTGSATTAGFTGKLFIEYIRLA